MGVYCLTLHATHVVVFRYIYTPSIHVYLDWAAPYGLLYGPVLYFAVMATLKRNYNIFLHLIPFCFYSCAYIIGIVNHNPENFIYQFLKLTLIKTIILSLFTYGIISLYLLNRYKIKLTIHFNLLTKVPIILCLVAFLLISTSIVRHEGSFTYYITRFMLYTMMLLVSIWVLDHRINLLIGVGNRSENNTSKKTTNYIKEKKRRYHKSALPRATLLVYRDRIAQAINEERLYLNARLDIKMMADHLNISKHHLSQVFSMQIGKTFNEYINEARVEHVCNILKKNNTLIIEHLAYESGFNSKASFYRHFKQHTGLTPLQYQENVKVNQIACSN